MKKEIMQNLYVVVDTENELKSLIKVLSQVDNNEYDLNASNYGVPAVFVPDINQYYEDVEDFVENMPNFDNYCAISVGELTSITKFVNNKKDFYNNNTQGVKIFKFSNPIVLETQINVFLGANPSYSILDIKNYNNCVILIYTK